MNDDLFKELIDSPILSIPSGIYKIVSYDLLERIVNNAKELHNYIQIDYKQVLRVTGGNYALYRLQDMYRLYVANIVVPLKE